MIKQVIKQGVLALLLLSATPLLAQTKAVYQIHPSTLFANTADETPKPYNLEKNKGFGYFTARFFIIAGGSFPITFGLSSAIMPTATPSWTVDQQIKMSLITAAGASATIALTDLIVGLVVKQKENNRRKRLQASLQ